MSKPFVVLSGLPGSGKTTLARRLVPLLGLPVIDKDDILERLFEERGIGDTAWRRTLSRDADSILQHEAIASDGAILVSFWHLPGMPADSGTPTDWLAGLSTRIVNLHCVCDLEIAAARFRQRRRHAGHRDGEVLLAEIVARLRQLPVPNYPGVGVRIDVDTSTGGDVLDVAYRVRTALG